MFDKTQWSRTQWIYFVEVCISIPMFLKFHLRNRCFTSSSFYHRLSLGLCAPMPAWLLSGEQTELKTGENRTTHRKSCDRLAITLTGNHVVSKLWAHVSASVKNRLFFFFLFSTWEHLTEYSIEPPATHVGYMEKNNGEKWFRSSSVWRYILKKHLLGFF